MSAKIRLVILFSIITGKSQKAPILPATESRILRANPKNRPFARNRRLHFTGKSQKSTILPVTEGRILRANLKNRPFDRNPDPEQLIERILHDTAFLNKKRIFPAQPSEKSSSQSKIINIIYSLQHRQSFRHGRFRLKKRLESL